MELLSPINEVKGVGEKTTKLLNNLGVYTVKDILLFFPRTYFTYPIISEHISEDLINSVVVFKGRVKQQPRTHKTAKLDVTSTVVDFDRTSVELVWFRCAYIQNQLQVGKQYLFYGKLVYENNRLKVVQPQIFTEDKYLLLQKEIQPIYSIVKGLTNNAVAKIVKSIISTIKISDNRLPENIIKKYNFMDYESAIFSYHFPKSYDELLRARKRLAFEELFYFVLYSRLQESQVDFKKSIFAISRQDRLKEIISRLPFALTKGQVSTLDEILSDFEGGYVTQRLIQGDVGSGKTIVAFLAMLNVCLCGYQAAIMAPTEVLAKQHYDNFVDYCKKFGLDIPVALFLGSQKVSEKKANQIIVDENQACFIIGTHALISEGREFNNLALVITDEQHRFGVKQREALAGKGSDPHYIVMSATPIPRTLAMILYGNMQVSTIKELPSNRLPIKSCVISEKQRKTAYKFIEDQVKEGHQVYIICPLVEASEKTEAQNVTEYVEELKTVFGDRFSIAMLHGKMKPAEKNEIMDNFANGNTDILVSTTVVEVGVNVPNATVMMIENANRFGLASLHQLRGRVGRGSFQSYCILIDSGRKKSKRLEVMIKSNDGFYIASEDLKLRGPGDMFGVRQSGEFNFKVADIFDDAMELSDAAKEVDAILKNDPTLSNNENIRSMLDDFLVDQSYML